MKKPFDIYFKGYEDLGYELDNKIGGVRYGVGFTAEYQAILDYATLQGYTLPSYSVQVLDNQQIVSLKAAGIWNLLDVFYQFATDGDSNFACINWKSPGNFSCLKVSSPTFTSLEGFTGNATTAYLNTQWKALTNGVNYTQNNAHAFAYVRSIGATGQILGNGNSAAQPVLDLFNTSRLRINGDNNVTVQAPIVTPGCWLGNRIDVNNFEVNVNGSIAAGVRATYGSISPNTNSTYRSGMANGNFWHSNMEPEANRLHRSEHRP